MGLHCAHDLLEGLMSGRHSLGACAPLVWLQSEQLVLVSEGRRRVCVVLRESGLESQLGYQHTLSTPDLTHRHSHHEENQRISMRIDLEVLICFDLIITTSMMQSADRSVSVDRNSPIIGAVVDLPAI